MLGFVVGNALAGVEFVETRLDLGKKHEALIASSTVASEGISRSASMIRSRVSGSDMIGFYAMPPMPAGRHNASPIQWAPKWAHEFSDTANRLEIGTFRGRPSLAWAQGSLVRIQSPRPLFRGPGFQQGSTQSGRTGVILRPATTAEIRR